MPQSRSGKETIAGPLPRDERRWSVRYRCGVRGECQPVTANEAGNHWPVRVLDISEGGVGLVLSRRFERGTLLALELNCERKVPSYMPLARVGRVTPVDSHWLLGCVWQGLFSGDELQNLVGADSMGETVRTRYRKTKAASNAFAGSVQMK